MIYDEREMFAGHGVLGMWSLDRILPPCTLSTLKEGTFANEKLATSGLCTCPVL